MKDYRSKRLLALVPAVAVMAWSPVAQADTAWTKAGRGLAALTTAFLEIPDNIKRTTEEEGAPAGWTKGFAMGLGMTVMRPSVGAYELITAPIPAPANYAPILKPEYPWSYFSRYESEEPGLARR